MQWSIQHITSSPRFPYGNVHAEKAVYIIKQIYQKANGIKLALLLLKTTPITNKNGTVHDAPTNMFFGRQLKAHLPMFWCQKYLNTCTENDSGADFEVPSKYGIGQNVWIKLELNTKWVPGKIMQVLPNQSYLVSVSDGCSFRRNEHHITRRPGAKSSNVPQLPHLPHEQPQSYNLRPRKNL